MIDTVEKIGNGSTIQHGKHNDRIYLMKLDEQDVDLILDELPELAKANSYSKVFCKIPKKAAPLFFANGYALEGYIPKFYKGRDDVFFVSKFLSSARRVNTEPDQLSKIAQLLAKKHTLKPRSSAYRIRKLNKTDVDQIIQIYHKVFESYPFPIHDPDYILKTMAENIHYFGAEKDGKLVALASSEMDKAGKNAEMTDFATIKNHGGNNLASLLLSEMEAEMRKEGMKTLYTIARVNSIPMNLTFLRSGYEYSGTLINNTNISGKIESMNIYYKHI